MHLVKALFVISPVFVLAGCSSVVTSSIAYGVAKHAEYTQKKTRRFSAGDRCLLMGTPSPYDIAEDIAYGSPISFKHNNILNNYIDDPRSTPLPPHHIAYAFYTIADRIGDTRAHDKQKWLEPYFKDGETKDIQLLLYKRYLDSYLKKCFYVPRRHYKPNDRRQILSRPF